ncbi:MAG: hypothetical protein HQM09_10540 [Candidatus Riflebacteria bacterium]|nr:hypothetical protein [Candidatus Riflebacteria bacterium]
MPDHYVNPEPEPGVDRPAETPASSVSSGENIETALVTPSLSGEALPDFDRVHRWLEPLTSFEKLFFVSFPLVLIISFIRFFFGEHIFPVYELGCTFGFTIAVLGPPFLRARRLVLGGLIVNHAQNEPVFKELYATYIKRHEDGWEPIFIAIIAGSVFAGFRLNVSWELAPYQYEVTRWLTVVVGTLGFAFFARTIWMFLAFGWLVSRLSKELELAEERLFSWDVLEAAGRGSARTAVGASLLSLATFWITLSTSRLFALQDNTLSGELQFAFGIFLLSIIIPMTYFLVPQWRLHRMLIKRKQQIRDLFSAKLHTLEHALLKKPDRPMAERYLQERQLLIEIENLPEWPFTVDSIARIATLVAIPALLFLFKEVLVDVVVDLVKR